jgi:hypothetical protein
MVSMTLSMWSLTLRCAELQSIAGARKHGDISDTRQGCSQDFKAGGGAIFAIEPGKGRRSRAGREAPRGRGLRRVTLPTYGVRGRVDLVVRELDWRPGDPRVRI